MRNKTLFQNKDFSSEFNKTSFQKSNFENDLINDLIKKTDYFKLYENDEDIFEHYKTIEKEKKLNKNNKHKNSIFHENNNENTNKFSQLGQGI